MITAITLLAILLWIIIFIIWIWPLGWQLWLDTKKDGYLSCVTRSDRYGHQVMAVFVNLLVLFAILYGWCQASWAGIIILIVYVIFFAMVRYSWTS